MIVWDVPRALLRQWVIVGLGGLATLGTGLVMANDPGVYFSRTQLVFLAPTSTNYPNALRTQSEDVIDTAGVVAKRVAGPGRVTKFASTDVTLVGLGVRDGWSLRLPDTGGQWATNFANQMLLLEVVGPSPSAVESRQQELVRRVRDSLQQLQREAGVEPINYITMMPAPQSLTVYQVTGSKARALGMTALLGMSLTITVALAVDRRKFESSRRSSGAAVANASGRKQKALA